MTLYLDYRVQSPDPSAINVNIEWHLQHHMLAVTSCSEEKGGFVTVYDELVCTEMLLRSSLLVFYT